MRALAQGWLASWHVQVVSFVLAAFAYALLLRFVLVLLAVPEAGPTRLLARLTDPILRPVSAITPRVVPRPIVIVFAFAWLFALRLLLAFAATIAGLRSAL
jgi:hypothetical protein